MSTNVIAENIQKVHKNIEAACKRAGRDVSEVTLIAVSKTKPVEMLKEAVEAGEYEFGENRVQELVDKAEKISGVSWHMIGHLQKNKVKYIIDKVACIHSLDTLELAEVIQKEAVKKNVTADVLIEVNVAEEESKFGITCENAEEFIKEISEKYDRIRVRGLMTVAPFTDNPESNRIYFKRLRDLLVDINSKRYDNINMDMLSMGMTGDYEIAIEEGATHVRVGTGIFGGR